MSDCLNRAKPVILSVDDEPCISRVVQLKLQNSGYDVLRAENGIDGLKQFINHMPDVLITDVKMPGMSGIELATRCLEYKGKWPFMIIVLTSQVDDETMQELRNRVDICYIPKPFSPREVLRIIDCYIKDRSSKQGAIS